MSFPFATLIQSQTRLFIPLCIIGCYLLHYATPSTFSSFYVPVFSIVCHKIFMKRRAYSKIRHKGKHSSSRVKCLHGEPKTVGCFYNIFFLGKAEIRQLRGHSQISSFSRAYLMLLSSFHQLVRVFAAGVFFYVLISSCKPLRTDCTQTEDKTFLFHFTVHLLRFSSSCVVYCRQMICFLTLQLTEVKPTATLIQSFFECLAWLCDF